MHMQWWKACDRVHDVLISFTTMAQWTMDSGQRQIGLCRAGTQTSDLLF